MSSGNHSKCHGRCKIYLPFFKGKFWCYKHTTSNSTPVKVSAFHSCQWGHAHLHPGWFLAYCTQLLPSNISHRFINCAISTFFKKVKGVGGEPLRFAFAEQYIFRTLYSRNTPGSLLSLRGCHLVTAVSEFHHLDALSAWHLFYFVV